MKKHDVDMLSGSITKGLLSISLPIMAMNVMTSLFTIVDMTVLKNFCADGNAVGAVGVCGVLITLFTNLVVGVTAGTNVIVARNIGRGDQAAVDRTIGTSIAFSIVAGLALMVVGISGAELFLRWNNCPEELLSQAVLYFRLYFAGTPVLMVYYFFAAIMRSAGDSKRPMIFSIASGVVKLALNYLFAAVFHMGVAGVAIATILSWVVLGVLGLLALIKNDGAVKIKLKHIRFYKQEMGQVLHIGVPDSLQRAMFSFANVIIASAVNSFGPAATTGVSIANNFDSILYYITNAAAVAVMPYVSQNVGKGNIDRATQAVWKGMLITAAFGISFGSLSAIFSGPLSSIMSSDPAAIAYSQQKMVIISSTYFICGINDIIGSSLRSMGKPMVATVCTLIFMCLLRFVWVYCIFPLVPNLTFLYLVWPLGWVLCIITMLFIFFPTIKQLKAKAVLQ